MIGPITKILSWTYQVSSKAYLYRYLIALVFFEWSLEKLAHRRSDDKLNDN